MNKKQMRNESSKESRWEKPEVIALTRNEPEKGVIQDCCKTNLSLLDATCNRPMRG
jgi:hypothetical protein